MSARQPTAGETEPTCAERNCRLATVILVDRQGRLLLQERDEHAPIDPDRWGLVGGHVEEGETWEAAVARELAEETGLHVDDLELWFDEIVRHSPKASTHLADRWRIWVAGVDLTDADVRLGEGRQIVFVDPRRVTSGELDLSPACRTVLPMFLESDAYRALRTDRSRGGSPGPRS